MRDEFLEGVERSANGGGRNSMKPWPQMLARSPSRGYTPQTGTAMDGLPWLPEGTCGEGTGP